MFMLYVVAILFCLLIAAAFFGAGWFIYKKVFKGYRMKEHLRLRDSVFLRYVLVAFIILCLLIPQLFVHDLIRERQYLQRNVVDGIASSWGKAQTFIGPILVMPVSVERTVVRDIQQADGTTTQQRTQVTDLYDYIVLPDKLENTLRVTPEERRRSIYKYTVYTSEVTINTRFTLPDIARELPENARLHLNQAHLSFGISDPTGLKQVKATMSADFLKEPIVLSAEPGTKIPQFSSGFNMPLDRELKGLTSNRQSFAVNLSLAVNGSGGVHVAPVGEQSNILVESSWPHPNFVGEILPSDRTISESGFTANWSIPHLARSYPQRFLQNQSAKDADGTMARFTVGANLFEPVTFYALVDRAVKYAILFIAMTFVALLAFEAGIRRRLHPVQYGLVGLSMIAFYLSLLSLAEHVVFIQAYMGASLVTISMISTYVYVALKNKLQALGMMVLLVALYALLYALLQMEDYALLVGTGLVLSMLAVLMYVTRNLSTQGPAIPSAPSDSDQGSANE